MVVKTYDSPAPTMAAIAELWGDLELESHTAHIRDSNDWWFRLVQFPQGVQPRRYIFEGTIAQARPDRLTRPSPAQMTEALLSHRDGPAILVDAARHARVPLSRVEKVLGIKLRAGT